VTILPSLEMATPSGSAVLLGFAELNQTMNGPFIGTSGSPIVTIANVFAVSRLKDTDVPHHSRDTECYSVLDSTHWPPTLTFARILDSFVMAMNP
jgi:hypothetical protein